MTPVTDVDEQSLLVPFDLCKNDWIANTMLRLRWKSVNDAQRKRGRDGIEELIPFEWNEYLNPIPPGILEFNEDLVYSKSVRPLSCRAFIHGPIFGHSCKTNWYLELYVSVAFLVHFLFEVKRWLSHNTCLSEAIVIFGHFISPVHRQVLFGTARTFHRQRRDAIKSKIGDLGGEHSKLWYRTQSRVRDCMLRVGGRLNFYDQLRMGNMIYHMETIQLNAQHITRTVFFFVKANVLIKCSRIMIIFRVYLMLSWFLKVSNEK
ncbi:hypothetical protein BDA99DRAFT_535978 [Phascolomyces articulosus]|uniref:Uncharacterized protein n=1 Tax=Phascolomyces articulosus TaxID=60185 RepID=A0AAD5K2J0_9FUNG|nr:hypothetical protein BDA99DRAFT_535978 [Phascolomyces articulosus]